MTTNFLSPMVAVTETDNTLGTSEAGSSTGGCVITSNWGEINTPTLCASESDIVSYFGKPTNENFKNWLSASNFLAYTGSLYVVRASAPNLSNASEKRPEGGTLLIENESDFADNFESSTLYGQFAARYAGSPGNSILVTYADNETFDEWEYKSNFALAPNTSSFAEKYGVKNDELHILVIDVDGIFTGTPGTVLEKYENVSKLNDAISLDGNINFYKKVINNESNYIFCLDVPEGWGKNGITVKDTTLSSKQFTVTLSDGADDFASTSGDIINAFELFENSEAYDVSLLFTAAYDKSVVQSVVNICETRKDCICFTSPCAFTGSEVEGTKISGVLNDDKYSSSYTSQQRLRERTKDYIDSLNISSTYLVADSGWKYQYDKYNDCYRWLPLNADIAGLHAKVADDFYPWISAAGFNRGGIKNCIKLNYSPSKTDRDILYPLSINPVVTFTGEGTVLFGDKTMLLKKSAFQQIGTRRLFVYLEKILSNAAKYLLFEQNDSIARLTAKNLVEGPLGVVAGSRGITNYKVVCDDTNNTAEIINEGKLVVDIYIQPTGSVQYVCLNFIAEKAGSSVFDETES